MKSYSFYVKFEGNTYGPYNIDEIRKLELLDDTLVMESSVGEWYPSSYYDFDELYMKEHGYQVDPEGGIRVGPVGGTAGVGNNGSSRLCPESAKGWCWGAFVFSWLWGICNNVYWPIAVYAVAFIVNLIALASGVFAIIFIVNLVCFVVPIILGINGKEMSWNNGNWRVEDVDRFNSRHRSWSVAAAWLFGIWLVLVVLLFGSALVTGNM